MVYPFKKVFSLQLPMKPSLLRSNSTMMLRTPSDSTAKSYGKSDKTSLQAAKTFRNGRAQP